jgi:large subunit ribosomal protein L21
MIISMTVSRSERVIKAFVLPIWRDWIEEVQNMYAVIESGGKQYRVQAGDVINVEKLDVNAGDRIEFDRVLVLSDGKEVSIGAPVLENARVFGNVIENGKAEKVIIFKYKSKKDYRKKKGHRQPYTMVRVLAISADGKAENLDALEADFKAKADLKIAEKLALKPVAKEIVKATAKIATKPAAKATKPAAKATKSAIKAKPAAKATKPAVKKASK